PDPIAGRVAPTRIAGAEFVRALERLQGLGKAAGGLKGETQVAVDVGFVFLELDGPLEGLDGPVQVLLRKKGDAAVVVGFSVVLLALSCPLQGVDGTVHLPVPK